MHTHAYMYTCIYASLFLEGSPCLGQTFRGPAPLFRGKHFSNATLSMAGFFKSSE